MAKSVKSKSPVVGTAAVVLGALIVLAACFGLKAFGDNRSDDVDSSRAAAAGGDYSLDTTIRLTVASALPIGVVVDATVSDESGWNGTKPTDSGVFANQPLPARTSQSADLVISTTRSKTPFALAVKTSDGTAIGTLHLDRDYLTPTCTDVKQGSITVKDCTQVNVWWLADALIRGKSSSCPSTKNSVDIGEFVDASGSKQFVKATLACSSSTGATTATLSQTANTTK